MTNRASAMLLAALMSGFAVSPAAAGVVTISARASTICRVDIAPGPSAAAGEGIRSLGHMTELCNSADGYRLVLAHPEGLVNAAVVVDGHRIPIDTSDRETIVFDSDLPGFRQRTVAIEADKRIELADLQFQVHPKGAVY